METLSEEQKLNVELFYYQHKCYNEIAAATGWIEQSEKFIQNEEEFKICMEKMSTEHTLYGSEHSRRYSAALRRCTPLEKTALNDPMLVDAIDGYRNAHLDTTKKHLNEINALQNTGVEGDVVSLNKKYPKAMAALDSSSFVFSILLLFPPGFLSIRPQKMR